MISKLTNPDVIEFIQENLNEDPSKIALQASKYPAFPIREIASQIASRQRASKKLPEWSDNKYLIFPPKENLEQASSQETAEFKASLFEGISFLDLTGGTGIDAYYLSKNFKKSVYVEPDANLCEIASHNFDVLKTDIQVHQSTAEEFISNMSSTFDLIYIDPSRRTGTKQRVVDIENYKPNFIAILPDLWTSAGHIVLKASPMVDIKKTINQLKKVDRVICLAARNEMKEILFELTENARDLPIIEAINLSAVREERFIATYVDERDVELGSSSPKEYIYEPNSAIRKAGFFKLISSRFSVKKLEANTHLYTSKDIVQHFPGRTFRLLEILSVDKKQIKKNAKTGIINVISKNFPLSANDIKKKYRLKDGGDQFLIFCKAEGLGNICLKCVLVS